MAVIPPCGCGYSAGGTSAPRGAAASAGQTAGAETVELDPVTGDLEAGPGRHAGVEPAVHRLGEVEDPSAPLAGEVMVAVDAAVEAEAPPLPDLGEEPLVREEAEVPVDGPEAHAGQKPADLGMHPLGGRMGVRAPHHAENEPARRGQPHAAPGEVPAKRGVTDAAPIGAAPRRPWGPCRAPTPASAGPGSSRARVSD